MKLSEFLINISEELPDWVEDAQPTEVIVLAKCYQPETMDQDSLISWCSESMSVWEEIGILQLRLTSRLADAETRDHD